MGSYCLRFPVQEKGYTQRCRYGTLGIIPIGHGLGWMALSHPPKFVAAKQYLPRSLSIPVVGSRPWPHRHAQEEHGHGK